MFVREILEGKRIINPIISGLFEAMFLILVLLFSLKVLGIDLI